MSCLLSTKRTPATKRTVLGALVAVKRETSGFYEPATIVDVTSKILTGNSAEPGEKFLLKFQDDSTSCWYLERHLIGQGFQATTSACLTIGQLVYCTVGHREVAGRLTGLPSTGSQLFQITLEDGQSITRKQEDMRLLKSRKSSRITASKDYHSLALGKMDVSTDIMPEPCSFVPSLPIGNASRKRAIPVDISSEFSNSLDSMPMPLPLPIYSPMADRLGSPDGGDSEGSLEEEEEENREEGDVLMDECSAALVLMSLGASPGSKVFDLHDDAGFLSASSPSVYGSSWPSSARRGRVPGSGGARRVSPSSLHDSTTASSDEGIEMVSSSQYLDVYHLDHDYSAWAEPPDWAPLERPRKRRPSNSVMFQCTWPKCQHMESTRAGVKKHIQNVHFTSAGLPAEDVEFYYNEIDGNGSVDSFSPSSPPERDREKPHSGHRGGQGGGLRSRSTLSTSSDCSMHRHSKGPNTAKPINIPRSTKRREWESISAPHSAAMSDAHSISSSAGSSSKTKGRDVKKCRKVYGMENREMWCTQCKWKKACTRFAE